MRSVSGLQAYSFASDVWSLGLSIVECLKGTLPFDQSPTKENKGDFFALALSVKPSRKHDRQTAYIRLYAMPLASLATHTIPGSSTVLRTEATP